MPSCAWELLTPKLGWLFLGAFLSPGALRTSPSHSIPSHGILLPGETHTPPWAASRSSFQVSDAASPKDRLLVWEESCSEGSSFSAAPGAGPCFVVLPKQCWLLHLNFMAYRRGRNSNPGFKTQR